jgi:hypothetical protein
VDDPQATHFGLQEAVQRASGGNVDLVVEVDEFLRGIAGGSLLGFDEPDAKPRVVELLVRATARAARMESKGEASRWHQPG